MFSKRFIVLYNIPQRVYFCLNRVGFCTKLRFALQPKLVEEQSNSFRIFDGKLYQFSR